MFYMCVGVSPLQQTTCAPVCVCVTRSPEGRDWTIDFTFGLLPCRQKGKLTHPLCEQAERKRGREENTPVRSWICSVPLYCLPVCMCCHGNGTWSGCKVAEFRLAAYRGAVGSSHLPPASVTALFHFPSLPSVRCLLLPLHLHPRPVCTLLIFLLSLSPDRSPCPSFIIGCVSEGS